jgi:hypothetical protein
MQIEVYRAADFKDVPEALYVTFDGLDDRYLAAFENYPDSVKYVVAAWATTGELAGEPIAVLVATAGHIITGFVDTYIDYGPDPDEYLADYGELYEPIDHHEPNDVKRRRALLARLRAVSPTEWLVIHDADEGEVENWRPHGFVEVDPPPDIPADEAVKVLVWGKLPEDIYTLLRARGLFWHRDTHRGFRPSAAG